MLCDCAVTNLAGACPRGKRSPCGSQAFTCDSLPAPLSPFIIARSISDRIVDSTFRPSSPALPLCSGVRFDGLDLWVTLCRCPCGPLHGPHQLSRPVSRLSSMEDSINVCPAPALNSLDYHPVSRCLPGPSQKCRRKMSTKAVGGFEEACPRLSCTPVSTSRTLGIRSRDLADLKVVGAWSSYVLRASHCLPRHRRYHRRYRLYVRQVVLAAVASLDVFVRCRVDRTVKLSEHPYSMLSFQCLPLRRQGHKSRRMCT